MKRWLFTLISALSFSLAAADLKSISSDELLSADTSEWLILDVRSDEEFAQGHVPNALNIAHKDVAEQLSRIAEFKDKPVVVYCRSGRRAGMAAEILTEAGFSDVRHLEGDIMGWKEAGHRLAK